MELSRQEDMDTQAENPQKPSRRFLWIVLPPVVFVVLILLAGAWLFWWPNRSGAPEKVITVLRGERFRTVVDSLEAGGVVSNRGSFELAARILGVHTSIKFGKYRFKSGMSNLALLRDLSEGLSNFPIPVRIPEGARLNKMAQRFSEALGVDSTTLIRLAYNEDFIKDLGVDAPSLEGYLLPNTYNFRWQTEETNLIRSLVKALQDFYVDSLRVRQEQLRMTFHEVVTLASIVEGETSLDGERNTIAGVYLNRLKMGMMLQADATIQYVLPDGPRRLLYSDLNVDSPYNTYRRTGLPPGPVNNPGRQSILAVLYPEKHQYLYFVADGTGGHKFSQTFSEHQRAVQQWRRIRKEMQSRNTNAGG